MVSYYLQNSTFFLVLKTSNINIVIINRNLGEDHKIYLISFSEFESINLGRSEKIVF